MRQTNATIGTVALEARRLADDVLLLAWTTDDGAARGFRAAVDGELVPPPVSHTAIPLGGGRVRNLLACRIGKTGATAGPISVRDSGARTVAASNDSTLRARATELDPAGLLAGFDAPARVRAVRFLADVCGSIFQLGSNPEFIAVCKQLVGELSRRPGPLLPRCTVLGRQVLCTGSVKPGMGERLSAVAVAPNGVKRVATAPSVLNQHDKRRDLVPVALLLDQAWAMSGTQIIIFGDSGMAFRQIADAPKLPSALEWLSSQRPENNSVRRYLLDSLARSAAQDAQAASLLRELQILGPQRGRVANDSNSAAPAGADLMIATPGGLFLSGWLRDPHGLAECIEVERGGKSRPVLLEELTRFPHGKSDLRTGGTSDLFSGFATFIPLQDGQAPDSASRLFIRLRSGARVEVAEGPCLLPPAEARDAILGAVPAGPLTAETVAACIAPALESLQVAQPAAPEIIDIGALADTPESSVIVSLSDDLDIARCRIGMLATDPAMSGAEIVHVASRRQQRAGIERLLRALCSAYGLSTRLIVVPEHGNGAHALNAAAQASRAPLLAFLGRGVLPQGSGWLAKLATFLSAHPRCGVVTPRLVFEDHSLAAAGAEFAVDPAGTWDVRGLYQGFPCDFAGASTDARIDAASGSCLVMRRSLFDLVEGFAPGYFGALRQNADFCAKVRSRGFEVWRATEPVLFELDVEQRLGTHDIRAELDRRRLEQRWRAALEAAPAQSSPAELRQSGARSRSAGRRRRRAA